MSAADSGATATAGEAGLAASLSEQDVKGAGGLCVG